MTNEATSATISPLIAQLNYLADMEKEQAAYFEAWWSWRASYEVSSNPTPRRTSFSYDDVPALDNSSGYSTPYSPEIATPIEHVQNYFEQARKNRENYNWAWSTAVEKRILCARNLRESRIKVNHPRNAKQLDAQFTAIADLHEEEEAYYEAWSSASIGRTLSPASASTSTGFAAQLRSNAERREQEEAYDEAWINAAKDSSLVPASSRTISVQLQAHADEDATAQAYASAWSRCTQDNSLITAASRILSAQLQASVDEIVAENAYTNAWSRYTEITQLVAASPRALSAQLQVAASENAAEQAYTKAWSQYAQDGSLVTAKTRTLSAQLQASADEDAAEQAYNNAWSRYTETEQDNSLVTATSRTLSAQLQASAYEDEAEQAYASAWSRYTEITQSAQSVDAWRAHHIELLRNEMQYYATWTARKTTSVKALRSPAIQVCSTYETDPFASQLAVFQDEHVRTEQYNEAWISYGNRHVYMAPPPIHNARHRPNATRRASTSRTPRPAFIKRSPIDIVTPELPMLGFSAIELASENAQYVASWVDKMKTTTITPANSLLLSPPSNKRTVHGSPRPKKRNDKAHFMWPEGVSEQEKLGMTARGNLQPYLSSLLGKIVSFELVGQSEPTVSPDLASPEAPMQITRKAHLECEHQVVCKVKASISIGNPEMATRYARDPLPLFDTLRSIGHAAVIQLDQVGVSPVNIETGRQAIWRKYSVVSGAFKCEVKETFVDRKIFSAEGCDFGRKVLIKDGLIMSPNGVDYRMLSV